MTDAIFEQQSSLFSSYLNFFMSPFLPVGVEDAYYMVATTDGDELTLFYVYMWVFFMFLTHEYAHRWGY